MENASKALIIAGTILIAILLIAMGIRLFNSAEGTEENAETAMKLTEVATFNSKFTPYVGTKSIDKVKGLVNAVTTNNRVNSSKLVKLYIDGSYYPYNFSNAILALESAGTTRFKVEIDDTTGFKNGLVCEIKVTSIP